METRGGKARRGARCSRDRAVSLAAAATDGGERLLCEQGAGREPACCRIRVRQQPESRGKRMDETSKQAAEQVEKQLNADMTWPFFGLVMVVSTSLFPHARRYSKLQQFQKRQAQSQPWIQFQAWLK